MIDVIDVIEGIVLIKIDVIEGIALM